MRFDVYGPFRIPKRNGIIVKGDLGAFWEAVENEAAGFHPPVVAMYLQSNQAAGAP